MPRIVGWSKACAMALTGDAVSAQEALACGLVSQIVPGPS
ncbi:MULTISPECIES: enoyl-CoA hydratase-related protein [Methylobacterium]|nr:enoyl-CoA hydratase-related protein [Methylobacterium sp.]